MARSTLAQPDNSFAPGMAAAPAAPAANPYPVGYVGPNGQQMNPGGDLPPVSPVMGGAPKPGTDLPPPTQQLSQQPTFTQGPAGSSGGLSGAPQPQVQPTPMPGAQPMAQGNPTISTQQIRDYAVNQGWANPTQGVTDPHAIARAATQYGVSNAQLDAAGDFAPGTSSQWRDNNRMRQGGMVNRGMSHMFGPQGVQAPYAATVAARTDPSLGQQNLQAALLQQRQRAPAGPPPMKTGAYGKIPGG